MGANRRSGLLWAVLVIAVLALPASVAEARKPPGTSAEFTVPGTNGYSLYVKSEKSTVNVVVANQLPLVSTFSADGRIRPANTGNVATNTYLTTDSSPDPNAIEADLGPLGRISVTFQPSGETRVSRVNLKGKSKKCVGAERIVRHLGTFTGTIEFRGESGYTTVDLPSAEGTVGTSLFRNCTTKVNRRGASASTRSSSQSTTYLTATNRECFFVAFAESNSPAVGFLASISESVSQKVILLRLAQAVAAKRRFVFNDALSSATLTPPAPFSGSGQFRRVRGGPSTWTGSLSVAFPGKTVPLTGPPFHASIAHGQ